MAKVNINKAIRKNNGSKDTKNVVFFKKKESIIQTKKNKER
jgi:hypothetical protein